MSRILMQKISQFTTKKPLSEQIEDVSIKLPFTATKWEVTNIPKAVFLWATGKIATLKKRKGNV